MRNCLEIKKKYIRKMMLHLSVSDEIIQSDTKQQDHLILIAIDFPLKRSLDNLKDVYFNTQLFLLYLIICLTKSIIFVK